jgi:hypothetical protein
MMQPHPLQRLNESGVTTDELLDSLLFIGGCSEAVRAAREAKASSDWDAYERACEAMTDAELERECRGRVMGHYYSEICAEYEDNAKLSVTEKIKRYGLTVIPLEDKWGVCRLCNIGFNQGELTAEYKELVIRSRLDSAANDWVFIHGE